MANIEEIVKELNDNCKFNIYRCKDARVWTNDDIDGIEDGYHKSYCYLDHETIPTRNGGCQTNEIPILCSNCSDILRKHKNKCAIYKNTQNELLEKILERLDIVETNLQMIKDHLKI